MNIMHVKGETRDIFFDISTTEKHHAAALQLVEDRTACGMYDGEFLRRAVAIIRDRNGVEAINFLKSRSEVEHESVQYPYLIDATVQPEPRGGPEDR